MNNFLKENQIDSKTELFQKFQLIKNKWIKTKHHGDQKLGYTFENLLGKKEDNLPKPDFKDIEIKTQRLNTDSLVSLFSKAPNFPKKANTYLRETYGSFREGEKYKVLNTTVSNSKFNTHRNGFSFKLSLNKSQEKLFLIIKNNKSNQILEKNVYWNFEELKKSIEVKLQKIAIVFGDEKNENGISYVKYNEIIFLENLTFENLIKAIENGDLFLDIRIGVYKSGKQVGKTHDHGSAFRIKYNKLLKYTKQK